MRPQNIQLWIVLTLFAISVACSIAAFFAVIDGGALSGRTGLLWLLCFAMLVALWANNDARIRGEQKPFEYSFFIFLLWPVALPYHLIRNRGIDGLVMFIGFLALHELPSVAALFAYAYALD